MPEKVIPFGDWLPDLVPFGNPGATVADNVVPLTAQTYGTCPAFTPISSTPFNGPPFGAFSAVDPAGNPAMYVGTADKLYMSTAASYPGWDDVSSGPYTMAANGYWSFTEADGFVYTTNGTDPIQRMATGAAGDFAPLGEDAPIANVIAAVHPGFLMCGHINDPTVGFQPQGVRWSALGDFTSFPPIGSTEAISAQSDWQKIVGPHGHVQAIATNIASANATIFFEQAVYRMVYTGDAKIFDIAPVEKMRGTPAARSVVQLGQIVYFLGHDGFYAYNGTEAVPIGVDRVNHFFFDDCDPQALAQVRGTIDPTRGVVFWLYHSGGAPTRNRILMYNIHNNRFTRITGFTGDELFLGRSIGVTLDNIDALGFNIDTLPYSLDSAFLVGGRIVLGGVDVNNRYGSFTGPSYEGQVETAEQQFTPGRRSRIQSVRPLMNSAAASAQIGSRNTSIDTVHYSALTAMNNVGICPVNQDGRYQRVRMTIPAGLPIRQHLTGVEVEFQTGGQR